MPWARSRRQPSATPRLSLLAVRAGRVVHPAVARRRTLRRALFKPRDHVVGITGSVPARAEQFGIIQDALPKVEALTLAAIVLIVGVAFRSVVAPLVAVLTTGVAYVMTLRLSGAVADLFGVSSPSELEPVIVALLLGVVTDYVVFYLSALRHELRTGCDRLEAARAATIRYGPIVAVAGLAVAPETGALLVASRSSSGPGAGPRLHRAGSAAGGRDSRPALMAVSAGGCSGRLGRW
jgi:RND superfamily putative drug exporter